MIPRKLELGMAGRDPILVGGTAIAGFDCRTESDLCYRLVVSAAIRGTHHQMVMVHKDLR